MADDFRIEIEWDGSDEAMIAGMEQYAKDVYKAVWSVSKYFEPILSSYAIQNAKWTDHTGNARSGLHSKTEPESQDLAEDIVSLWLSHKEDYGIWLEVISAGKWAIIAPTLEAHYGAVEKMLKDIFS